MTASPAANSCKGFIGIHMGAGKYNSKKYPVFKSVLDLACLQAIKVLRSGGSALRAVAVATSILEDSKITNAGCGSNLTWEGEVECDAGLMEGSTGHFGAVGAVQQVRNPIQVAHRLCQQQSRLDNGLLRPCILVGAGALAYALETGASEIYESGGCMICPASRRRHARNKERALAMRQSSCNASSRVPGKNKSGVADSSDLAVDTSSQLAVGPSSTTSHGAASCSFSINVATKRAAGNREDANAVTTKRKKHPPRECDISTTTYQQNANYVKAKLDKNQEKIERNSNDVRMKESGENLKEEESEDQKLKGNDKKKIIKAKEEQRVTIKESSLDIEKCDSMKAEEIEAITSNAQIEYVRDLENLSDDEKNNDTCEEKINKEEMFLDTVGAVCVDIHGNLASSCSSGGIILKRSGRLGQACVRGAGCWAQNPDLESLKYGLAVSTSGPGEFLIRTSLAQEVGRAFRQKPLSSSDTEESVSCLNSVLFEKTIRGEFLESPFLQNVEFPKLAGVLLLLTSPHDKNPEEFLWAHTSPSFGVAYMSTQDTRAHIRMSSLPDESVPGTSVNVESVRC